MSEWGLARPRGQLTLQSLGHDLVLWRGDMHELRQLPMREDEAEEYRRIWHDMLGMSAKLAVDRDTRQAVTTPIDEGLVSCISYLQLISDEERLELVVIMRSADVAKLSSDLSFLCGCALTLGVEVLRLHIVSLHLVLRESDV